MTVGEDLSNSAKDFLEKVWPKIKHWFGSGELIPVESIMDHSMSQLLDTCSGIDSWYIEQNKGIRGIASRVQWGPFKGRGDPYNTFTIRLERETKTRTEYEKLCNAIDTKWLYPHWFCQSYLTNIHGDFMDSALCNTDELMKYIKKNKPPIIPGPNANFYAVNWVKYGLSYPINIYSQEKNKINKLDSWC